MDVRFAENVARWIGVVSHRAELAQQMARVAAEQGRRTGAEELVMVLAHDLRNYVMPLDLRLHGIQERANGDGREKDQRDTTLARKGLRRLMDLITDILDVSRVDQGVFPISVQPLDLVLLVRDAANVLETSDRPIEVNASERVVVAADPARMRQCFDNLLANAVKHSPQGVAVTVNLSKKNDASGEKAHADIIDHGPGISPEIRSRIFEPFVTGRATDGGLGLGLYLAKRIALMHDGDLTVTSEPGQGARFSLILPCLPALPEPDRGEMHGGDRAKGTSDLAPTGSGTK
jgi:signal transduction histidine kinase